MTCENADMVKHQPAVTVVIPAKNEAENIRPLINEIRTAMDDVFDYELIYVDDGSTDETFNILKNIREEGFNRLKVIRHQQSVGQSFSVLNGARNGKGEWLVVLDADGQNDPADIPGMLKTLQAAYAADPKRWGSSGIG